MPLMSGPIVNSNCPYAAGRAESERWVGTPGPYYGGATISRLWRGRGAVRGSHVAGRPPRAGFGMPGGGQLSKMVVAGVADRGGAVGRSGLGEDPVDVAFDGLSTDVELGCDVGVRHSPGHHGEDLGLAQGQAVGQLLGKPLP